MIKLFNRNKFCDVMRCYYSNVSQTTPNSLRQNKCKEESDLSFFVLIGY